MAPPATAPAQVPHPKYYAYQEAGSPLRLAPAPANYKISPFSDVYEIAQLRLRNIRIYGFHLRDLFGASPRDTANAF